MEQTYHRSVSVAENGRGIHDRPALDVDTFRVVVPEPGVSFDVLVIGVVVVVCVVVIRGGGVEDRKPIMLIPAIRSPDRRAAQLLIYDIIRTRAELHQRPTNIPAPRAWRFLEAGAMRT